MGRGRAGDPEDPTGGVLEDREEVADLARDLAVHEDVREEPATGGAEGAEPVAGVAGAGGEREGDRVAVEDSGAAGSGGAEELVGAPPVAREDLGPEGAASGPEHGEPRQGQGQGQGQGPSARAQPEAGGVRPRLEISRERRRGPPAAQDLLESLEVRPAEAIGIAPDARERRREDGTEERRRDPAERLPEDERSCRARLDRGVRERQGGGVQEIRQGGERGRGLGQARGESRPERRLERRERLVPEPRPRAVPVLVRRVLAPGLAPLPEEGAELLASDSEERPPEPDRGPGPERPHRPHPREPPRPRTTREPEEDRLGLVVPCVRDRDGGGPLLRRDAGEERVALPPRDRLEGAPLPREDPRHVRPPPAARDPEPRGERLDEVRVGRALRPPDPVVQRRDGELEPRPSGPREIAEQPEQGHRIPAPRARDDDSVAVSDHAAGRFGDGETEISIPHAGMLGDARLFRRPRPLRFAGRASSHATRIVRYGFLIDHTRCIGCHACTVACKEENRVPLGVYRTWVKYVEKGTFPDARRFFTILRCNHCDDAPCISICPTRALFRRKDGIVDFDPAACIGCKSCMQACPYEALYLDPETNTAAKCNFCAHRVEVGLEPACVVVCPEQAIVAGDLDEPKSRIAQLVAAGGTEVRKPEQGTKPKVFYRGAESAALRPDQLERGEGYLFAEAPAPAPRPPAAPGLVADLKALARTVYDVPHLEAPWGWKVATYLWTKSVASGALFLGALGVLAGRAVGGPISGTAAGILALAFLAATTALLVGDLERPDRFHFVLTRPNWGSWLVRGAWVLMGFGLLAALWLLGALLGSPGFLRVLSVPAALAALAAAGYSAFLFHQAEGRDFWQRKWLLLAQLLAASLAAGSAALLLAGILWGTGAGAWPWLVEALAFGLVAHGVLAGVEILGRHPSGDVARAARVVSDGELRGRFWVGVVGAGILAPLALLHVWHLGSAPAAVACLLSLGGLWLWESLWIRAGQSVPLS